MIISHPAFREYQRKPLTQHLTSVASGCMERIQRLSLSTHLIGKDDLAKLAYRIGLLHDLGKASSFFQNYIRGGPRSYRTNHSLVSAIVLYFDLQAHECWQEFALIGFKAAQRHHGNLSAFGTENLDNGTIVSNTLEIYSDIKTQISLSEDLKLFVNINCIALPDINADKLRSLNLVLDGFTAIEDVDDSIERFLVQNLLFSVLIDADK